MTCSYLDHPSEEALERFLLHHAQEDELDGVETHILSCDACVTRLEELELQMAAVKLALQELSRLPKSEAVRERHFLRDWFTVRTVSWAGAVAALALTVTLTPQFKSHPPPAADVTLSATRGSGVPAVPQDRLLRLHLNAQDIANGPVQITMVEADGSPVWKSTAQAQNEKVEINAPKLTKPGTHFLRIYSVGTGNSEGELLREFPFEVKTTR